MAEPRRLIAFLSDFGWSDPYVGIVHGVVEKLTGGSVKLVDLTHDVPAFSVTAGAYILYTSYRYFPEGTVFLAVVDPGVGTERRPVTIKTRRYFFVGPDNGLLYPAAAEDGIEEVRVIANEEIFLKPVSYSFHGRDIFAPAAARIALGASMELLGPLLDPGKLVKLELRRSCPEADEGRVEAKVVYIDRFGNAALGLEAGCREKLCRSPSDIVVVRAGSRIVEARCLPVFSRAAPGEVVFYVNSLGFPELAANMDSAARKLELAVGDTVELWRR
ncbi:MAG: S-adenosyl-l-methionine hydroxide adenosyltransferase family protein [Thermoproteota archaeon]